MEDNALGLSSTMRSLTFKGTKGLRIGVQSVQGREMLREISKFRVTCTFWGHLRNQSLSSDR